MVYLISGANDRVHVTFYKNTFARVYDILFILSRCPTDKFRTSSLFGGDVFTACLYCGETPVLNGDEREDM